MKFKSLFLSSLETSACSSTKSRNQHHCGSREDPSPQSSWFAPAYFNFHRVEGAAGFASSERFSSFVLTAPAADDASSTSHIVFLLSNLVGTDKMILLYDKNGCKPRYSTFNLAQSVSNNRQVYVVVTVGCHYRLATTFLSLLSMVSYK